MNTKETSTRKKFTKTTESTVSRKRATTNYKEINKSSISLVDIFSCIPIFAEVYTHEGLLEMADSGRMLEYPPQSTIVQEDETGSTAFIILEGEVEVLRKSIFGDDFVVATLTVTNATRQYPFIGEQSLISKKSRTATVRTLSAVRVLELHHDSFISTAEKFPIVGMHMYQAICTILQERLSNANKNVVALFEAYMDTMSEDLMESAARIDKGY